MGMSHRPPDNGREGKFFVTEHALERLRERARIFVQYSNPDLIGLVNEAAESSTGATKPRDIIDSKGEPAQLAELTDHLDQTLAVGSVWALIKQPRTNERRPAIVTIIDGDNARRMIEKGRADDDDVPPFNPAFSALKEVKLPDKPASITVSVPPPGLLPQYLVLAPGNEVVKVGSKEEATTFIANDESNRDLRLFKECRFRTQTIVQVMVEE